MTWHSPVFFILLLLIAGALFLQFLRPKRLSSLKFSQVKLLSKIDTGLRAKIKTLPLFLKIIAFVLVVFALARPQESDTKVKRNVEGIDIVITLDISDSMLIEDMRPENRLEASKEIIRDFIKGRSSDRIGLVVFSGEAYTRVPATLDYPLLLQSLSEVETTRNIKMGTAIGVALANASGRLSESTAKSKVVIFLTDGENNSGTIDPETALEIAKGYGIKIYTIGVGKDGDAQLPITVDGPGGQKFKQYRPIHSKVNDELLSQMADDTGGKYWRVITAADLKNVFNEIDKLEKTKIEVNQFTRYTELFYGFLLFALLIYGLAFILQRFILQRSL